MAAFVVAFIIAIGISAGMTAQPTFLGETMMFGLIAVFAVGLLVVADNTRHKIALRKAREYLATLPLVTFEDFCARYPGYSPDFLRKFREVTAGFFRIEVDQVGPALDLGPSSPLAPAIFAFYFVLFDRFCPEDLRKQKLAYPMGKMDTLEDLLRETEKLTRE